MKQPWIRSLSFDLAWMIAPLVGPVLILLIFPPLFNAEVTGLDTVSWVFLILLVDVAHVYSTLFRTYLNPRAGKKLGYKLYIIPFVAWVLGVMLFSVGALYFWRLLAYLAVFHFIRQQYGFMRIYSRQLRETKFSNTLNQIAIYSATLLPVLIWHFEGPRNFNWFVEGDFFYFPHPDAVLICKILFFIVIGAFVLKEFVFFLKERDFNLPRFLLVNGTAASWYTGIVVFNGDLAFTALNVLAHGIPYLALVWHTEQRENHQNNGIMKFVFARYGLLLFFGIIFIFSFVEEGLWDSLVWREHTSVFKPFYFLPAVHKDQILAFLVPALALPQIVHYLIDGFIWRVNKRG